MNTQRKIRFVYALTGVVFFVLFLHPLTMVFYWLLMGMPTPFSLQELLFQPVLNNFSANNLLMTLVLGIIGAVIGLWFSVLRMRFFAKSPQDTLLIRSEIDLNRYIAQGESAGVEFKSSLRWDRKQEKVNKGLEVVVAKTICGMMNHQGGLLLIGVDDDGTIAGIEADFCSLKQRNWDGFQQRIMALVANTIGGEFTGLIKIYRHEVNENTVAVIQVAPSPSPAFLNDGNAQRYYLRSGSSTRELDSREAVEHVHARSGS